MNNARRASQDFTSRLVETARETVARGYYGGEAETPSHRRSLVRAIWDSKRTPVICEVKFVSPAEGRLRRTGGVTSIARTYEKAGAVAISVLTEPRHFGGRLEYVTAVKKSVQVPVLMKDVVVDRAQIDAAARVGADAILLIARVYARRLVKESVDDMVRYAHSKALEVLLEVHDGEEYEFALRTRADLIGINNRDLDTLEVSLETSKKILRERAHIKPVVSESGLSKRAEIESLVALGADAFLVGSALMKLANPTRRISSLVGD